MNIKNNEEIIDQILEEEVKKWEYYASEVVVNPTLQHKIQKTILTHLAIFEAS